MKNGIIINKKNVEKIKAELNDAQKRCSVRLIQVEQVFEAVAKMEEYRKKYGILKKNMEGVTVRVNLYQDRFPSAYKYTPEGTVLRLLFKGGKWRLFYAYRDTCEGSRKERYKVELTEDAKENVLNSASTF